MIYNEHVQFIIPREGAHALLTLAKYALCSGCPAGMGAGDPSAAPPIPTLELWLVTNNPPISSELGIADLELSLAVGGEPITVNREEGPGYCEEMVEGPAQGADTEWRLVFDQQIWSYASGDGAPIFALALVVDDPTEGQMLLGYAVLPGGPAAFTVFGDIIKLTADLVLLPQIPVEPEPA